MNVLARERGGALLTVLLLVAVMATIAATALDRIGVGTRLAANAATAAQARSWLGVAELLAATQIEDLLAGGDSRTTLAGGWIGTERSIALPDGAIVGARIEDGSNCFNLNSLVARLQDGILVSRPQAAKQFTALMTLLGIGEAEAGRIAASATDYIDSDREPFPGGAEDGAHGGGGLSANQLMVDPSELRLVAGVTERHFALLHRWVCALPTTELSPINVNTLLPEQAPLLAMLAPGKLNLARARAQIASRPAGGYGSVVQFWQSPALAGVEPDASAAQQVQLRTSFFTLHARVLSAGVEAGETALIDARARPVRVVRRQWTGGS